MGKNYKEKSAYHYLHDIKNIPYNMLLRLRKKWNRHNFDTNEIKVRRVLDKDDFSKKKMIEDINDYKKDK